MVEGEGDSLWFTYLLNPSKLATDLASGQASTQELQQLLKDLLTNLLNNQQAGFFTDNPQELWFAKTRERKSLVLRNLSLQVAAYLSWKLATLETLLPPPLLLYLLTAFVQAQPEQTPQVQLALTANHTELDLASIAQPGPTLQALTLLHRWVVRTFMAIRTPARQERTSTVMVPGVKRDPAVLYRDQTHTLVSAVAPTSIKFLELVVAASVSPASQPTYKAFPTNVAAVEGDGGGYAVQGWDEGDLSTVDRNLFLSATSYDLGCCYFFCEDYARARSSFAAHFSWRRGADPTLGGEVNPAKLAGYCLCLGLETPNQPPPTLPAVLATAPQAALASALAEENLKNQVSHSKEFCDSSGREVAELDLKQGKGGKGPAANVLVLNLVARSLKGLPISLRTRRQLEKLPPASLKLLQDQITSLVKTATSRQLKLLKALVVDLLLSEVVGPDSALAALVGLKGIGSLSALVPTLPSTSAESLSLLLASSSDKVQALNSALQLITSTKPNQVSLLASGLGLRTARKVSSRWNLEADFLRPNQVPDLAFVLLAKASQLRKVGGSWEKAKALVTAALADLQKGGTKDRTMVAQVEGELLELDHLAKADIVDLEGTQEVTTKTLAALAGDQANLPSHSLATSCIIFLLNAGDWDSVTKLSHANMPYIVASRNSAQATVFQLARNLAFLMHNMRGNNLPIVKKFGKDVWDALSHLCSSAAGKRKEGQGGAAARERALVASFLGRVTHPSLLALILSLLASLHNAARDDPVTEVFSAHAAVWPTGLASNASLQERQTEELLVLVLARGMAAHPQDATMLRMRADLQFAAGRHSAALSFYLESVAVKTDFFQLDCGPPAWLLEEAVVGRMVTCCRELGRLMQAVVLSQFCQEPNYAQAFKFLEDSTEDGADSLYGCIWDMAILEFAMSLHTKRGEVARRRAAKHCIWQLELNTNNDEEILNEAANVRRAMFLRSLSAQFF